MATGSYFGVDSKARKIKTLYFGVDGVARKVKKAYIGVAGKARLFWETVISMPLSELPEGAIVNVNENGTKTPFYLAKHNYESGLNGAGRNLMVRKDCYDERQWHEFNRNAYAVSTIDSWMNGDYKALFSSNVQEAMGTTKFYYTPGNGNNTVTTLERSIFMLSVMELGTFKHYADTVNIEGTTLPIASILQIAYYNGSKVYQWTRSSDTSGSVRAYFLDDTIGFSNTSLCKESKGSRPCFTLPSTMLVDSTPNADGSYNLVA